MALVLGACGAQPASPADDGASSLTFQGNCDRRVCADLPRPEIGCEHGAPKFVCAEGADTRCAIRAECPSADEPNPAVSMFPCDEAECGPKPTTPEEACGPDRVWGGSTCGKLNGNACAWHSGCVPHNDRLDRSKIGEPCDQQARNCPEPAQCLTLRGLQGAHCIADPCGALACAGNCLVLESEPPQYVCE